MNAEGTAVLFQKLRLIISPAHMRTHTYARARARVYIDSFRFSFQKMVKWQAEMNV